MTLPAVNQRVEVTFDERNGESPSYVCWVQDAQGDLLTLAAPMKQGYFVKVPVGSEASVSFSDGGKFYFLSGTVQSYGSEPPVVVIRIEGETVVQRRDFFRWEANLVVEYAKLDPASSLDIQEIPPEDWHKATTTDISGGGLRLATHEPLDRGLALWLKIFLPTGEVRAQGEVVRAEGSDRRWVHFAGVMFTTINQAMQDAVIRYIFTQEMAERRKDREEDQELTRG